jgi:23S rRNA (cytidine1920-2'-O)/16S rRNA (cytidine1409-2'-O)-methyltransferase
LNFKILDVHYSPITGPEGNIEYLMYIEKTNKEENLNNIDIEKIVEISHKNFNDSEVIT